MKDPIERKDAIDAIQQHRESVLGGYEYDEGVAFVYAAAHNHIIDVIKRLPSAQPEQEKYEHHYDHTDCIWYRLEARNRCPVTCAQYRDGWNDAMDYIFRDGKGYMPYRRGKQYE